MFTLVVTDFGIAKVIGGQFNVLATDAYKQVVGQQNFEMGAVVGMVLLVAGRARLRGRPAVQRRQVALALCPRRAARAEARTARKRRRVPVVSACVVGGLIVAMLGSCGLGSFITYWPYNLTPHLKQLRLRRVRAERLVAVFRLARRWRRWPRSSAPRSCSPAPIWSRRRKVCRRRACIAHFLAMLPMAVPGLVLGLGYVFFFNAPLEPARLPLRHAGRCWSINSSRISTPSAHITALTALKQIDPEFEAVSASLKVPF